MADGLVSSLVYHSYMNKSFSFCFTHFTSQTGLSTFCCSQNQLKPHLIKILFTVLSHFVLLISKSWYAKLYRELHILGLSSPITFVQKATIRVCKSISIGNIPNSPYKNIFGVEFFIVNIDFRKRSWTLSSNWQLL